MAKPASRRAMGYRSMYKERHWEEIHLARSSSKVTQRELWEVQVVDSDLKTSSAPRVPFRTPLLTCHPPSVSLQLSTKVVLPSQGRSESDVGTDSTGSNSRSSRKQEGWIQVHSQGGRRDPEWDQERWHGAQGRGSPKADLCAPYTQVIIQNTSFTSQTSIH